MTEPDSIPILVVEDDDKMREACAQLFRRADHPVDVAADGEEALRWLEEHGGDCIVLSDVRMPALDGMTLLDHIGERWPAADVIIMTGFGTIDDAVAAMKAGAADYVTKPFNKDELLIAVERVAESRQLRRRVDTLTEGLEDRYRFESFVATSPAMDTVIETMRSAARSSASVLLTGESGTGKDLVARTIHHAGPRSDGPFVPINCASLPESLIESELFGHERGAYTGAGASRRGLVREAQGGTLLLDEITEMPSSTQATLLRALQERRIRPVGGSREVDVDFRLLAATNRDVEGALAEGDLREDLFYRINVLHIHLPPLRERTEDILPLVHHLLESMSDDGKPRIREIAVDAVHELEDHPWPGNVRELSNLIERALATGVGETLSAADVRRLLRSRDAPLRTSAEGHTESSPPEEAPADDDLSLARAERRAVRRALESSDFNKAEAARRLGISRKTLYEKIHRYGLDA